MIGHDSARPYLIRHPRRPLCLHVCDCGAVHVCGDPDKCTITDPYLCYACELDALDDYLTRYAPAHQEETDHERF
jgi:hypothetical protein